MGVQAPPRDNLFRFNAGRRQFRRDSANGRGADKRSESAEGIGRMGDAKLVDNATYTTHLTRMAQVILKGSITAQGRGQARGCAGRGKIMEGLE